MSQAQRQLLCRYCERDDRKVAKAIREGKTKMASGTGWALMDEFFIFMHEIGFFKLLGKVEGEGYKRKMVAIIRLLMTYSTKVLLGIAHLRQVPDLLFKEVSLLKMIGFTAVDIREGVCKRGKGKSKPMHRKILGDMLSRLTGKECFGIFNGTVKTLSKKGYIPDDAFIMDTSPLETTERYENRGMKKVTEKKWDRVKKKLVEIVSYVYGFKLGMIQGAKSRIPVSCIFSQIQIHDNNFTVEMVKQAEKNIGRKIKLLLIDCGFLDGENLWWLHGRGTNFITRARTNMTVSEQLRSFREDRPGGGVYRAENKDTVLVGVEGLTTYDQYGDQEHGKKANRKDFEPNPINGIMVVKYKGVEYSPGKEKVFITDLPVDDPFQVLNKYGMRSLIENAGFRELKQGWHIDKFPVKKENAVRAHAILTLTLYALNAAYQTDRGQKAMEKGIRRLRRENYQSIHKIIIYSGDYFGIFDIEELMVVLRAPPQELIRTNMNDINKRLGLKD